MADLTAFFSIPTAQREPASHCPATAALLLGHRARAGAGLRGSQASTQGKREPLALDPLGALFVDRPIRSGPPSGLDGAARAKTAVESGRGEGLSAVHPVVQRAWKAG